mgnify:CR=1 FL=1
MDPDALAFLIGSWLFIIILVVYCFAKLFKPKK